MFVLYWIPFSSKYTMFLLSYMPIISVCLGISISIVDSVSKFFLVFLSLSKKRSPLEGREKIKLLLKYAKPTAFS